MAGTFLGGLASGAIGGAVVNLTLNDAQFKSGLAGAEAQTKGAGVTMSKFGGLGTVAFAALGTAALKFGADSVRAFAESEQVMAQTEAVLKSTGSAAGFTAEEIAKTASELQSLTTFSDEEVQSAENLLLTFTNIGNETLPQATEAVLDMSQALGQDLKTSSIQLGKALNDPIAGLTSLSRVGVKFTAETKAQITTLVTQGKTLEAQQIILKELATEFGGSAAAAADTFNGQMKQMANSFSDLKEIVGKFIVEAIAPLIQDLAELAHAFEAVAGSAGGSGGSGGVLSESIKFLTSDFNPLVALIHYTTWSLQQLDSLMGGISPTVTEADGAIERINKRLAEMGVVSDETGKEVEIFAGKTGAALKDYREATKQTFSVVGEEVVGFKAKFENTARSFIRGLDNMRKRAQETFRDLREFNKIELGDSVKQFLLDEGPAAIDAFVDANKKGRDHIVDDIKVILDTQKKNGEQIDIATGKTNNLTTAVGKLGSKRANPQITFEYKTSGGDALAQFLNISGQGATP